MVSHGTDYRIVQLSFNDGSFGRSALDLWHDNWLAGIGPGGFYWRFPAYIPVGSPLDPNLLHPHNLWLEYATTGGILALAWLVSAVLLVVHAVFTAYKQRLPFPDWPAIGLLAAFAAALAHAQVDAFAALADLAAWNWLAFGILIAALSARPHNWQPTSEQFNTHS